MRIQENLEKSKYEADGSIQIQGTTTTTNNTINIGFIDKLFR